MLACIWGFGMLAEVKCDEYPLEGTVLLGDEAVLDGMPLTVKFNKHKMIDYSVLKSKPSNFIIRNHKFHLPYLMKTAMPTKEDS